MTSKGFQESSLSRKTELEMNGLRVLLTVTKQLPVLAAPLKALLESGEVSSKTDSSVRHTGVPAHIYWMIPSWKHQKCWFSIWDPSLPPLLLLIVQNQVFFSPSLVHKRKSINARKHRQMPSCSQGLPRWLSSRACAADGSGDKQLPTAHNSGQCWHCPASRRDQWKEGTVTLDRKVRGRGRTNCQHLLDLKWQEMSVETALYENLPRGDGKGEQMKAFTFCTF